MVMVHVSESTSHSIRSTDCDRTGSLAGKRLSLGIFTPPTLNLGGDL